MGLRFYRVSNLSLVLNYENHYKLILDPNLNLIACLIGFRVNSCCLQLQYPGPVVTSFELPKSPHPCSSETPHIPLLKISPIPFKQASFKDTVSWCNLSSSSGNLLLLIHSLGFQLYKPIG